MIAKPKLAFGESSHAQRINKVVNGVLLSKVPGWWDKTHPEPPFHQKQPPVPTHPPNTEHKKEATHPVLTTRF